MRAGVLRVRFWALGADGARGELLGTAEQGADGSYPQVWTTDGRAVEAVLELRDGEQWREVRARRSEGGGPRVLTPP